MTGRKFLRELKIKTILKINQIFNLKLITQSIFIDEEAERFARESNRNKKIVLRRYY